MSLALMILGLISLALMIGKEGAREFVKSTTLCLKRVRHPFLSLSLSLSLLSLPLSLS